MEKIKIGGKEYGIQCKMASQARIYEKYPDILSENKNYDTKKNLEFYMDVYFEVLNGQFESIDALLDAMTSEEYQDSYEKVLQVFWGNKEKKTQAS
jgi:hypothetical protein